MPIVAPCSGTQWVSSTDTERLLKSSGKTLSLSKELGVNRDTKCQNSSTSFPASGKLFKQLQIFQQARRGIRAELQFQRPVVDWRGGTSPGQAAFQRGEEGLCSTEGKMVTLTPHTIGTHRGFSSVSKGECS